MSESEQNSSSNEAEQMKNRKIRKRGAEKSANEGPTSKRSKKRYKQKYCADWENIPELKNEICKSDKGPYFFYCKICKRLFSKVKAAKTDTRNRIETATLEGILHTKELIETGDVRDLEITKELLDKLKATMYDDSNASHDQ